MDMKKAKINGRLMTVVDFDEYINSQELYTTSRTAIELSDLDLILPVLGKYDTGIGIAVNQDRLFSKTYLPNTEDTESYSTDLLINMSNVGNISELMQKQELVRSIEYEILTSVDNKFEPKIGENDTPAMKAMKTAVIEKGIDINKYSDRFGSNFNNDKRQFNKPSISLQMLERLCKGLDIKATLILEDTSPDIANPIGRKIISDLTGGDNENED